MNSTNKLIKKHNKENKNMALKNRNIDENETWITFTSMGHESTKQTTI